MKKLLIVIILILFNCNFIYSLNPGWNNTGVNIYYSLTGYWCDTLKGWNYIDNNWYYFDESGRLQIDLSCNNESNPKDKVIYWSQILYNSKKCKYDNTPSGRYEGLSFDCSSFVGRLYKMAGIDFFTKYYSCEKQANYFKDENKLIDLNLSEPGDLVYFGENYNNVTHCSLVIENNPDIGMIVLSAFGKERGLYLEILDRDDILCIARPC